MVGGSLRAPRVRARGLFANMRRTTTLALVLVMTQPAFAADDTLLGGDLLAPSQDMAPADAGLLGGGDLLDDGGLLDAGDGAIDAGALFGSDDDAAEAEDAEGAFGEHAALFKESNFPSAATCATCHPKQYKEWSVSQHAYAQLSPFMLSMQNTINVVTQTTNGDFCLRCHAPVGSELNEPMTASNLDRHPASREGITCVSCHRINKNFGKVTGRITLERGDIFQPIYGPSGNDELERVLQTPDEYRVVTSADGPGRGIHKQAPRFFELTTPGFCGTCHDVMAPAGVRIEEAFSEYKNSPAAARGVTCQDCHMGRVQGVPEGYEHGPAAVVGDSPTQPRKLTNHFFAGPDYSIIHPGIFPHNVEAQRFKTLEEWLQFDVDAGWGTDAFELAVPEDYDFPEAWRSIDDRYDARRIIGEQRDALAWAKDRRLEVLRNAFDMSDIRVTRAPGADGNGGLGFEMDVINISDGHVMPDGFDAERLFFLEIVVTDADGDVVYLSGDRDPNGDLRDRHSLYVKAGELPRDDALFNLQSKFMARLLRGGEREQVLPSPVSLSVLPYIRPEARPSILYGQAKGVRKHRKGIEPLGSRTAAYEVPAEALTGSRGPWTIEARFVSQALPVNLVTTTKGVGFDYGMSPREVADRLVEGAVAIRERTATVPALGDQAAAR